MNNDPNTLSIESSDRHNDKPFPLATWCYSLTPDFELAFHIRGRIPNRLQRLLLKYLLSIYSKIL